MADVTPFRRKRTGSCETCGGLGFIRIVNDLYRPDHNRDCPTCVGVEIAPGLRIFSVIPRDADLTLTPGEEATP